MKGTVLGAAGDCGGAVREFLVGLVFAPDDPRAHFNLGSAYRDGGETLEALTSFERAAALAPDFAEAHLMAGRCRRELGDREGALKACLAAVRIRPDHAEARLALGAAYRELRRPAGEASADVPEVPEAFELGRPESYFYLGLSFLAEGEPELALQQLDVLTEMRSPLAGRLEDFCRGQAG
jgi:tetratricopeptide (TPR) repeat protein